MYCKKCGAQNPDNALTCASCGTPVQGPPPMQPTQVIPNYLAQSIFVTLCCCLPLGIPAIVFASQVNGKVQSGDIPGAIESSNKAKMWFWIAFGVGIVTNLIVGALQFLAAVAQQAQSVR